MKLVIVLAPRSGDTSESNIPGSASSSAFWGNEAWSSFFARYFSSEFCSSSSVLIRAPSPLRNHGLLSALGVSFDGSFPFQGPSLRNTSGIEPSGVNLQFQPVFAEHEVGSTVLTTAGIIVSART